MRKKLLFVVFILLIFSCLCFVACDNACEEHNYKLISSEDSTCAEKGYDLYQCTDCKEFKREEKQLNEEHTYDTDATCAERECVVLGCDHKEEATTEHDYKLISSEDSTCAEKGYDLYQCTDCKEFKREEKQLNEEHTYDTNATCAERECVVLGCDHKEEATTEHDYKLISSEDSTCAEKGYDLYQCTDCKEFKREEKQLNEEHTYDTNATCAERECAVLGCNHKEEATTEHDYTNKYVCSACGDKKDCSLTIIGNDYKEELLNQARLMAGSMTGNFEVVVLGKEETLANIENYTFDNRLDKTKIIAGLFVKFDVIMDGENIAFTIYYNFGLQFSEEQKEDIGVTYDGSEIWYLEVVNGNQTILFEYSITIRYGA